MMNLLREKSRNIQFEAFHVFKVGILPATTSLTSGFCRKSQQIKTGRRHPAKEQGQDDYILVQLSQR